MIRPGNPLERSCRHTSDTATTGPCHADGVFFLFGFGDKQQDLGPGEVRTCPRCGNTSQWARVKQFRQVTVFFVPIARWRRRQLEVCDICGTSVEI